MLNTSILEQDNRNGRILPKAGHYIHIYTCIHTHTVILMSIWERLTVDIPSDKCIKMFI